ncbi:MAG: resistance to Congo red protein [Patescibacteria group bacterium]
MRAMEQAEIPKEHVTDELQTSGPNAGLTIEVDHDARVFEEEIMKQVGDISPELKNRLEYIWNRWLMKTDDIKNFLAREMKSGSLTEEDTKDPKAMGAKLFASMTGRSPHGNVYCINKGPLVYFTIAEDQDYIDFYTNAARTSEGSDLSGGFHHPKVEWEHKEGRISNIPIIVQKGAIPRKHTITHESQHFINHSLIDFFEKSEQKNPLDPHWREVKAERGIKDELLAFLRDGRHVEDIYDFLNGNDRTYAHHYDRLSEATQERIKRDLRNICNAITGHPWFYSSYQTSLRDPLKDHKRELLVASLIDVPFQKITAMVQASADYYSRRMKKMLNTPPPIDLRPQATPEERARWNQRQSAFVQRYNSTFGFLPEYSLPDPQKEQGNKPSFEEDVLHIPPPIPPDNTKEDQARYEREHQAWLDKRQRYEKSRYESASRQIDQW